MKFSEVKPKNRKFTLEVDEKEAEMLKAVVGQFNSVGQTFTGEVWSALDKLDIADTYKILTYNGSGVNTLEVHPL